MPAAERHRSLSAAGPSAWQGQRIPLVAGFRVSLLVCLLRGTPPPSVVNVLNWENTFNANCIVARSVVIGSRLSGMNGSE